MDIGRRAGRLIFQKTVVVPDAGGKDTAFPDSASHTFYGGFQILF
jgi:hypothetical protein